MKVKTEKKNVCPRNEHLAEINFARKFQCLPAAKMCVSIICCDDILNVNFGSHSSSFVITSS